MEQLKNLITICGLHNSNTIKLNYWIVVIVLRLNK